MKLMNTHLFKETAEGIALVGQKCRTCGKIAYPKKRVCPECFGEDLEEKTLSRTGTLHTFTNVVLGAPHLKPPYITGFVDLPEKIRVLSVITGCDADKDEPRVDMPVEIVLDKLMQDENGEDLYCYKFKPLRKEG
ncbi:MAG: hypothetical protein HKP58_18995 [Desulfatitalea sp.]|nr:hypothetical protein [Desulfatitalea sp.]